MAAFKSTYPDKLSHTIIMYDVRYSHVIGELKPQALQKWDFELLNSFSESLYEMLRKDYVNTVMAVLNIPDYHRGSHQLDENTTINSVKCGQSDDKDREAISDQETVTASLPQDRSDKLLQQCKLGRHYTLSAPIEKYSIFYIGCESRTLSNLIISYQSCQVWWPSVLL